MADKKYYWLKLKRDFFKRHDIRIIESMQDGKEYILFYLKLLCESVDHEGKLRFSDKIPYSEEMLSTITNTKAEVVKDAIQAFTQYDMMELMDDGTLFMREVEKMIGTETTWAEKKRQQRQISLGDNVRTMSSKERTMSDKRQILESDIDSDIESYTEESADYISIPSLSEVRLFFSDNGLKGDPDRFFYRWEAKRWKIGDDPVHSWKALARSEEKGIPPRRHSENSSNSYENSDLDYILNHSLDNYTPINLEDQLQKGLGLIETQL